MLSYIPLHNKCFFYICDLHIKDKFVILVTTGILSANIITTDYSIKSWRVESQRSLLYFFNASGNMCLLNFLCSDLALCDWGCRRDYADISEVKAARRYCTTEGGKQVCMDQNFLNVMVCLTLVFMHTVFDLVFRAISYIMSTLFYPVITFFLLAVCISYWAVTAVYPSHYTK